MSLDLGSRDSSRYKTFSRRAMIIAGGQGLAFVVLAGRMYYLQIIKADEYRMMAEDNRVSVRLLAPLRGTIVDRYGTVLASNRQNYRAILIPEQATNVNDTLDRFSRIVALSERDRKKIMRDIKRSPRFMPVTVSEGLSWEQFAQFNLHEPDLAGMQPDVGETRHYPYATELAHVVGYVGPVSDKDIQKEDSKKDPLFKVPDFRIGKSGIEKAYDSQLRGQAGARHVEVNAYGRIIRELSKDPGTPGSEVVLTLDMHIQRYACERLKDESASAVVMDIHNGDVLAFVSTPGFDPNDFNIGLTQAQWKALVSNPYKPLTNKAIAGLYPPGSTFKMVTAIAALESGIDPKATVYCNGRYAFGDRYFHCWKREGHGTVDMHEGIKHSCDVYFYEMSRRMGVDPIENAARRFGLGETYDFDVPGEKAGIVPGRNWKRAATGTGWQKGETLITGIGQGFLLATPLQLAVMAARLANGGYAVKPRLTRAIGGKLIPVAPAPRIESHPEFLTIVQNGMNGVSNEPGGTAYGSRITEPGLELAGKTGSAQVRRITMAERSTGVRKNEQLAWHLRDHALFVCFAPVSKPRYAMSVVVEHGGSGSRAAAPAARDIMREVLIRNGVGRQADVPLDPATKKEG